MAEPYKICPIDQNRLTRGETQWVCLRPGCTHKELIQRPEQLPDIVTINRVDQRGGGHGGRHRPTGRVLDLDYGSFPDPYRD